MSATTPDSDVAARERQRAARMSIGEISNHVHNYTWPRRAGKSSAGPLEAWRAGEPVHYPGAANGVVARWHRETNTILLARMGCLVTVIPVDDRSQSERQYIRNQVTDR